MSKVIQTTDYPAHLLDYIGNISANQTMLSVLFSDEYIFATYFVAAMQGLPSDEYDTAKSIVKKYFPRFSIASDYVDASLIGESDKQKSIMGVLDSLRSQFSEQISMRYARDFFFALYLFRFLKDAREHDLYTTVYPGFSKLIAAIVEESKIRQQGITSVTQNIQRIQHVLDLSAAEASVIEMTFMFSMDIRTTVFRDFMFQAIKHPGMFDFFYHTMLGSEFSEADVNRALSSASVPISLGIVSYNEKTKRLGMLSEYWSITLAEYSESDDDFFAKFVAPMTEKKKSFSGALAKIPNTRDKELVQEFLQKSYSAGRISSDSDEFEIGNNVIVYGSKNLDKLGCVYALIKDCEMSPWQVNLRQAKYGDIPAICKIAQEYIKSLEFFAGVDSPVKNAILIIDKAEQALSRQRTRPAWMLDMLGNDGVDGAKDDELTSDELLLIKNPVPTIWITDSISGITPENVGRFSIHIELKGGSRKDRRDEVQRICEQYKFSSDLAQKLSMYYELSSEQIVSAARTSAIVEHHGATGEQTVVQLVEASQKALDREKTEELRASVTKYNLDMLNLSGTMEPAKIIEALKRNPTGTLCFYGLPGTGKTALAEYMAMQLDMPIIIKPASELLSMWLGEAEKNIAKMFDEAKSENAILLLDEADSFLRDRSQAQRSWEVTQVNELLQRMERFPGIFICTTNLFESIDAAALRRFTFKLEFLALREDQRLNMLATEAGIDLSALSAQERDSLELDCQLIPYLTPGDFAVVKRQSKLLGETLSTQEWLRRLASESKAKLSGIERNNFATDLRHVDVKSRPH